MHHVLKYPKWTVEQVAKYLVDLETFWRIIVILIIKKEEDEGEELVRRRKLTKILVWLHASIGYQLS